MSEDERFRRDEELLRRALREEADAVLPSLDALSRIRRRTARPPLWRRPVVLGVAAASVTAVGVIAGSAYFLGGTSDDTVASSSDSSPTATQDPSPAATQTPGAEPTDGVSPPPETGEPEPPAGSGTVPVYYVTTTPAGDRLAREFRQVPTPDGPLVAAVHTMLTEPAVDPDYNASVWGADTQVLSVEVGDTAIEVDLTGETDYTGVRDEVATLAVQQLVYTVTAAASNAGLNGALPVQILVDGEPPDAMWGQLDLSAPVARAPELGTRLLVQIDDPAQDAVVGSTVTVTGAAATTEANVLWEIQQDGDTVQSSHTTAQECCRLAPFTFTVELAPGSYTVIASQSDESGGTEGFAPMSDSKDFTVE
jgi:hypothetical protein